MRKAKPKSRILLPDPKYKETLVTRFVNYLMEDGKKSVAYGIFYDAVELVEQRTKENGLETWKKALNNIMPSVEVKSRRVGELLSKCRLRFVRTAEYLLVSNG
ncbi:hypothetical protein GCM10028895_39140 [Pontibacter rugosus]